MADLHEARRKFSESRLKELCDEYADNYPQLDVVLFRFYGLGEGYTIKAIGDFIRKLMSDPEVKQGCAKWIFQNFSPYSFVSLLYGIGFFGIKEGLRPAYFKVQETQPFSPANLTDESVVVIHETYRDALQLQDVLVSELDDSIPLKQGGLIVDLPESYSPEMHRSQLLALQQQLPRLKTGVDNSESYEGFVGELIKLCFFRSLGNVESKVRSLAGRTIRDWVAGNHATGGFWSDIRNRYKALNVVFECKNYDVLRADDFAQAAYYMNDRVGNFCVICYRGRAEIKSSYYEHIREIATKHDGMVLLLGERDIEVLLRQAINRKNSEPHLREILDRTLRKIG